MHHTIVRNFQTSLTYLLVIISVCEHFPLFTDFLQMTTFWFVAVTPKFRVYPQNPTEAYEGYPVMIHCIAEGDPKPTIKWDRNSNFSGFDRSR